MRIYGIAAALACLVIAGCSDAPTTVGEATPADAPSRSSGTVSRVDVTPSSVSLSVGHTVQLTARAYDANGVEITGKTATWSSSSPSVATVNTSGVVTGNAAGSATVYAGIDGVYGSASISVTSSDYSVSISGPEFIFSEGTHTWNAVFTGDPGARYTEWRINWGGDYSDEYVAVGTGDTFSLNVSSCDPDFDLRVVVHSQTLGIRQADIYVLNMSSGSFCY